MPHGFLDRKCHIHGFPPTPPYASASPLHITSTQAHFHFHLSTCYSASTCFLNSLSFSLLFNAILLALFPFGDMSHSLPLTCLSIISVIARYHYLILTFWHTYSTFPPLAILLFPSASFPFSIPPPPTVYKHSPSHYVLQSEYRLESTRISTWVPPNLKFLSTPSTLPLCSAPLKYKGTLV